MRRWKSEVGAVEPKETPFIIVSTSSAELDPATRKQLRSFVMRGKNRKQNKRHERPAVGSWINGRQGHINGCSRETHKWVISQPLGIDLTTIPFVDDMKPYMLDLTHKWLTVLKQAMYPIEACVQPDDSTWLEFLAYDRAYLHSILCSAQAYFDFIREARLGEKAIHHLNLTLSNLRRNLADSKLATSDSTIFPPAAKQHMQGLYQLVSLRGGIAGLRHKTEVQAKVLRADLGIAINTSSKPLFFSDGISWDSYLFRDAGNSSTSNKPPSGTPARANANAEQNLLPDVQDIRLLNILADLQEFSQAANIASQTGRKIPADLFSETLVSAQYRLLALRDEEDTTKPRQGTEQEPESEAEGERVSGKATITTTASSRLLLLGMLAFTTTTFLQIKQMPTRYADLARRMRACLAGLSTTENSSAEVCRLGLWFVFVARISVLDGAEDEEAQVRAARGLLDALRLAGAERSEVRDVLRGYMWIDWVHSEGGKAFWGKLR
ncbi:hypothetical protein C8A03DRAFT_43410 [Achaetomium macrosporum]|uniref:Uncharacterized protein n=1 Tax=Achaetomium macrosporum TaxID=79813 RepID=A0AAN7CCC9_9PEZI|nr:hypothetical protein C8A03DRAFT_43410 [Achaetomium macrosporum]